MWEKNEREYHHYVVTIRYFSSHFPIDRPKKKEDTTEVELLRAIAVHSFCRFPSHGVNQTTKEMGMRRSFVFPLFFLKKRFAIINHPADTAIYLFLFLFFAIGFLCFSSISDWPLPASWAFLKKRGRWWFPGQTRSLSIPLSNRTCPSQCQDPLLWFIRHVKYILDRCWPLTSFSMRLNCPFAASLKYHQRQR